MRQQIYLQKQIHPLAARRAKQLITDLWISEGVGHGNDLIIAAGLTVGIRTNGVPERSGVVGELRVVDFMRGVSVGR